MGLLAPRPGERLLIVGAGTGADFPLLPSGTATLGIDLSPAMLAKAWRKLPLPGRDILLVQGDAQQPLVEKGSCDAVLLNLILSVIPDGAACLRFALRSLKTGGRAAVFY